MSRYSNPSDQRASIGEVSLRDSEGHKGIERGSLPPLLQGPFAAASDGYFARIIRLITEPLSEVPSPGP